MVVCGNGHKIDDRVSSGGVSRPRERPSNCNACGLQFPWVSKEPHNLKVDRAKIFIAHDGPSELRDKLELECWRMSLEPIVVEEQTSLQESIDDKVNRLLADCTFAIVIARKGRGLTQDDQLLPRANVIDEIERVRASFGDRFLLLLEMGLNLPTNLSTAVVYEPFSTVDSALLHLSRALRHHNLI